MTQVVSKVRICTERVYSHFTQMTSQRLFYETAILF